MEPPDPTKLDLPALKLKIQIEANIPIEQLPEGCYSLADAFRRLRANLENNQYMSKTGQMILLEDSLTHTCRFLAPNWRPTMNAWFIAVRASTQFENTVSSTELHKHYTEAIWVLNYFHENGF